MATFKPTVRGERRDGFMQVILHFTVSRDKIISDILCGHGVGRAVVYCI